MTKSLYLALAASAAATALAAGFQTGKSGPVQSRKSNLSVSAGGAKSLSFDLPLAEIHLSTGRVSQVTVHAIRSYRGPVSEIGKKWLNDSVLRVERQGGAVVVEDLPFGKRNSHLEGPSNASLDLEVTIPEGLDIDLDLACGTVDGGGKYRSFHGSVAAGTLKLQRLACDGELNLKVSAGEVTASLASTPSRNSSIRADVGSVGLELPKNADADVLATISIGNISGLPAGKNKPSAEVHMGDKRSARFGKGGVKLNLEAGTGDIRVGSVDRAGGVEMEPVEILTEIDTAGMVYPEPQKEQKVDRDEIAKSIKEAKKEMERAMKELHDSKEFGQLNADIQREVAQAMKEAQVEVAKAMEEARAEIKRAMKESKAELDNDPELSKSIQTLVESAMQTALAATDQALKATQQGLRDAEKSMNTKAAAKSKVKTKASDKKHD